jgi:hypothetical protein
MRITIAISLPLLAVAIDANAQASFDAGGVEYLGFEGGTAADGSLVVGDSSDATHDLTPFRRHPQ